MNKKITRNIRYTIFIFLTFLAAAVLFTGCADQSEDDLKSTIKPSKSGTESVSTPTPNTEAKSTPNSNKGVDFDDFMQTGSRQTPAGTAPTPTISDDHMVQPGPTAENNNTASNTKVIATPQQKTPQPIATQAGGEEQTDWTKPVK